MLHIKAENVLKDFSKYIYRSRSHEERLVKTLKQRAFGTITRARQCLNPCTHATRPTKLLCALYLCRVNRTDEEHWLVYQTVVRASKL
jgi:hypothetical protein